jgi:hypothetical protein
MPRDDRTEGGGGDVDTPMSAEVTLRAFRGRRQIFSSVGKWLYPLFELEEFLRASSYAPVSLRVEDKIVGKAAALLLVRLGVRHIKAGILSELGRAVLERYGVQYSAAQIVERIDCRTETLLVEVEDPEQAYRIVKARASL